MRVKTLKAGQLVYLEWEDSYGCSPKWEELPRGGEPEAMVCKSVGWVCRRSRRFVTIVPHVARNERLGADDGCGDMVIPTAAIRRVVVINDPSFSGPVRDRKRQRS